VVRRVGDRAYRRRGDAGRPGQIPKHLGFHVHEVRAGLRMQAGLLGAGDDHLVPRDHPARERARGPQALGPGEPIVMVVVHPADRCPGIQGPGDPAGHQPGRPDRLERRLADAPGVGHADAGDPDLERPAPVSPGGRGLQRQRGGRQVQVEAAGQLQERLGLLGHREGDEGRIHRQLEERSSGASARRRSCQESRRRIRCFQRASGGRSKTIDTSAGAVSQLPRRNSLSSWPGDHPA
jgi:hypothetical protein